MTSDDGRKPFNNPFGALRGPQESAPAGGVSLPERKKTPEPAAAGKPTAAPPAKTKAGRAVIRLERTGRGGKEVTIIERIGASAAEREQLLKKLKSGLGCGGAIEGDAIVLQGDQRKRLPGILT
jgi:translation initiation factor 1